MIVAIFGCILGGVYRYQVIVWPEPLSPGYGDAFPEILDFPAHSAYKIHMGLKVGFMPVVHALKIKFPAASSGVSIRNHLNAPRGRELNPFPPLAD